MSGSVSVYDMHVHLGWMEDPAVFARGLGRLDTGALAVTVTPADWERLSAAVGECESATVRCGLGLHPWYVTPAGLDAFLGRCRTQTFIGEVGLDAGERHAATFGAQVDAFERVCVALEGSRHVVSIHAVRSAGRVMDMLEAHGLHETSACILHWFSGTSDELARARRLGLWFSVSRRMLATKRGRAYAKQIPAERLLLETDAPEGPESVMSPAELRAELDETLAELRDLLDRDISGQVADNSRMLLGL